MLQISAAQIFFSVYNTLSAPALLETLIAKPFQFADFAPLANL